MSARNGPVISEFVLARSYSGRQTPYQWLARAISVRAELVCDVACGAGRMSQDLAAPGRTVIGLDIAADQLRLGRGRSAGPWVQADARQLPFAAGSLDAVTTAMGLAVISPLSEFLPEVARVLRPGGVFAAIMPTVRPLRLADISLTSRLSTALRSTPRLATSLEVLVGPLLQAAGLTRAEDRRERYGFKIESAADARALIAAIHPSRIAPQRLENAVEMLTTSNDGGPVEFAIPVRRIVAVK